MIRLIITKLSRLVYHRHLGAASTVLAAGLFALNSYILIAGLGHGRQILGSTVQSFDPEKCCLEVSFLDVGQGDSIYITAPNGNSMLIDAGPPGGKSLAGIAQSTIMFDRHIDVTVATHGDADHIGSLPQVLKKYSTALFIDPKLPVKTSQYADVKKLIAKKNIGWMQATRGMKIILDGDRGVTFEIMHPDEGQYAEKYFECIGKQNAKPQPGNKKPKKKSCDTLLKIDTNESSVSGILTYGSKRFMLTGDSSVDIEQNILNVAASENHDIRSDVLKAGHHGSKTSTAYEFVKATSPEFVIVSAGKENKYGHPHQNVLDNISRANPDIRILRTDESGTIRFLTDGKSLVLK